MSSTLVVYLPLFLQSIHREWKSRGRGGWPFASLGALVFTAEAFLAHSASFLSWCFACSKNNLRARRRQAKHSDHCETMKGIIIKSQYFGWTCAQLLYSTKSILHKIPNIVQIVGMACDSTDRVQNRTNEPQVKINGFQTSNRSDRRRERMDDGPASSPACSTWPAPKLIACSWTPYLYIYSVCLVEIFEISLCKGSSKYCASLTKIQTDFLRRHQRTAQRIQRAPILQSLVKHSKRLKRNMPRNETPVMDMTKL